jgi:hypothetical protein
MEKDFEDLKQVNQHGIEYWSARSLQPCLGYFQWRRFENAIQKAIESCKQSGNDPDHHFAGAGKPIPGGKGSSQVVVDYHLRMTQTREKLKREGIKNQRDAIEAHETVGKEVRAAIAKIGGTPPENIPPAEHIKKVEKRLKTTQPILMLDPKDAAGIATDKRKDL